MQNLMLNIESNGKVAKEFIEKKVINVKVMEK
jgi:hypothetical protein